MAANNKIARLSTRIEALAGRRWGRLTLDSLTDEAWAKLEELAGGEPSDVRKQTDCEHLSNDALLRLLIDAGYLSPPDFKRR